jgi:hypothetical protein
MDTVGASIAQVRNSCKGGSWILDEITGHYHMASGASKHGRLLPSPTSPLVYLSCMSRTKSGRNYIALLLEKVLESHYDHIKH